MSNAQMPRSTLEQRFRAPSGQRARSSTDFEHVLEGSAERFSPVFSKFLGFLVLSWFSRVFLVLEGPDQQSTTPVLWFLMLVRGCGFFHPPARAEDRLYNIYVCEYIKTANRIMPLIGERYTISTCCKLITD